MAYDLATVTNLGNQLLASVVSDKSSLVIDKIEVSGTQLASSTDLKSMKSISNVVKTLSANGYQKKDTSFIISTVLDNSSVTADYKAWVFGIWAHEADGGSSTLMSVITSTSSPDTISKGSGTPIDYNYKFITTFSNTSSLTIQMASDTYATNDTVIHNSGDETATGTKTFQEIKISNNKFPNLVQTDGQYITLDGGNTEIVPADNSKIVHTTGDETIDGQKKFKTDPTDGAGNAYAKTVDVNQQLDKKVVDNKDGTEQLNGVQVQPYNKLSDTIGGRNLLINTAQLNDSTVCLDNPSNTSDTYLGLNIYQANAQWRGERIYLSYLAPKIKTNTNYVMSEYVRNTSPTTSANIWIFGETNTGVVFNSNIYKLIATLPPNSEWTRISILVSVASFPTTISGKLRFENATTLTDGYVQFAGLKFEQGSIATDWTPAPEDKVNVSDMRKPASDVAGIEEVNAKQDEIGYTPADDSKVAHLSGANNFDTVPTVNNNPLLLASSLPSDLARTGSNQEFTGKNTFDTAPIDKTTGNPYITKDGAPTNYAKDNYDGTITANGTVFNLLKSLSASSIPQDPTRDYNTLPQGLAVMTESGGDPANMPPVKSTYLTLTIASSYATGRKRQLAWLDAGANSSNNNYTYIRYCVGDTWSSWDSIPTSTQISSLIPSTIADTTKPANFTAGLQSGGVSVATSDDLKSVENSAWHSMTGSSDFFASFTCLYKINTAEKRIELIAFGGANNQNNGTIIDLSSIISGITSVDGSLSIIENNITDETNVDFSGTKLTGTYGYTIDNAHGGMVSEIPISKDMGNNPCYVYYTGLV